MRDGSTRILLAIDLDTQTASVVDPSVHPAHRCPLAELLTNIWLRILYPSGRVGRYGRLRPAKPRAHWFLTVVRRFWSNYSVARGTDRTRARSPLFIMNAYDRVVPNGAGVDDCALDRYGHCGRFHLSCAWSAPGSSYDRKLDVILASNIFEHVLAIKMAQRRHRSASGQMREFDLVKEFSPPAPWCRSPTFCSRSCSLPFF